MPHDLAARVQALGKSQRDAARIEADMAAMARRYGVDAANLWATDRLEALAAETCCAACREVQRCQSYLDGKSDQPEQFCPNSTRFTALASKS